MPHLTTVSVIVPLYNKAATVERAIRSILIQSYRSFEIIVVNDGSLDKSPDIVERLMQDYPEIQLNSQLNAGPGAARNAGVLKARGDLIAFLDADDEWRKDYLRTAVSALTAAPEALAFVSAYDAGPFSHARPNKILQLGFGEATVAAPAPDADGPTLKMFVDAMHSSCVVVRRAAFNAAGGYFQLYRCLYGEDSWLWGRVLLSGPIFWDPDPLALFHVADSELGFAIQKRQEARPISRLSDDFLSVVPLRSRESGRRLAKWFAEIDYNALLQSGSWAAAAELRSMHRINGALGIVKEWRHRLFRPGD